MTAFGVEEVCRKAGISQQTYYRWRKKYGGLMPSEVRRLKQLEEENRRLKQMVADLSLDKAMLQDVLSKSCEACAGAAAGGRAARHVPGLDPTGLPRAAVPEILLLLPLRRLSQAALPSASRRSPRRASATAIGGFSPAAAGGMGSKRQARLSAVRRRRHADRKQTAQAQ